MEIYISIINKDKTFDICVDENNTIENVLNILKDKNLIKNFNNYVFSNRLQANIANNLSFKQGLIKTGDKIYV